MKNHSYTVKSVAQAWNKVDEIFPTDYEKDSGRSSRAGYQIYSSTADGHWYDYICDLGDRLEVNLSNGDTVNIWIKDESELANELTEAEIQQKIADNRTAKEAGAAGWMNVEPRQATVYNFCVMHADYAANEAESRMADALDRADNFDKNILMGEYVAAWCDANGVPWGSIEIFGKATRYEHGRKGNYHYVFRAVVTKRTSK